MVQLFDRVLWLMAAGEITIDEASRIARLIADWRPQVEAVSVATASTAEAADRPAASRATHAAAARPAFDLQTAGKGAAAPVPDDAPPLNRHDRRRAAVLARTARAPTPDPTRLTAAA